MLKDSGVTPMLHRQCTFLVS